MVFITIDQRFLIPCFLYNVILTRNYDQGKVVKSKGTKLLVKNIPFEGTKSEIRELFSAFGQIKSVRMPTKFDGSHRG